jgi:tRNA-2-methylthio-N6-dimethylallyladenosine synthase
LAVADVEGIRRVRFTTSHPSDFTRDIVEAIEREPRVCDHVHLPVQSGSTRVLRAMQRTYSREEYLDKIAMIRGARRPIGITTDVIVGFPGETESAFGETLSLLEEVQYDSMFSFKYSPRPNTSSLSMSDLISEEEKGRRLAVLQDKQREIQSLKHASLLGEHFEVLVSGKSRRENQWTGYTTSHRMINFTSQGRELLGTYVQVRVTGATPNSLVGEHAV